MDEKIRETVDQLNSFLGDMPYKVDIVDPRELTLLEKNARYMTHEMFQNLVTNIKRDGGLSSLPLVYYEKDGRKIVLSGNHRVQAAVAAEVPWILILRIDRELSRQEQVAIQLSHNAIEGKDDPVVLKGLWGEILDIDLKLYAGLDSETLKELEKMQFATISEAAPDFKQMVMMFLPEELEELKQLIEGIDHFFSGDVNYVAAREHYEHVFKMLVEIKEKFNIVNNPTAFMKMVEMAKLYMEGLPPAEVKKDAKAADATSTKSKA
ncbi:MAG: ParB/Srx family N-terminal domain-containing protein [Nitrospirota bacterium]